ncbi:MAG: helicase-exonuclease AddAB subunit AddB [Firmicutes bacterium]|nr:helicase-exonuclease AddAB subunit AddB [Bacillota bacterium]
MGLRLVLGRAGSGKSDLCLREIAAEIARRPDGCPLVYIVPEQATFQAEYALATSHGLEGMMRAQVLSFRRLAWRVMQETGGGKLLFIDDTGKGMVLRKILEKCRSKLKVFRYAEEQVGALDNLVRLHNELKRACLDVSQLKDAFRKHVEEEDGLPSLFKEKLGDLILIMEEAEKELSGHYLDAEDYLNLLTLLLPESSTLKGAEIWVDGFYGFTIQEYQVLEELFNFCSRVTVTICLDRDCLPGEKVDELDPFYPAAITCQRLQQRARARKIPVEKIFLERDTSSRFAANPDLVHLEKNLQSYPLKPFGCRVEALRLAAAPNRRCEVESLAREIIALVRDEDCRWRDMVVIACSPDDYRDIISTVFSDYRIPFFHDRKRGVIHHPLVEFIRSAMEVVNHNWRYEAVFRCIKTEFLFPLERGEEDNAKWREWADRLENYVLAYGIRGAAAWQREEPWEYRRRDTLEEQDHEGDKPSASEKAFLDKINEMRAMVSTPLADFQENFRVAKTAREKTAALYGLLAQIDVAGRLEFWSKLAQKDGNPEKVREHRQVYKGIVELMDQLVELMGEETLSMKLFAGIVEAGLEALRLSLVPPSLDQVFVGDVDRSRPDAARYVFLLGVNDGALPSRPREDGIFSEEEREALNDWGLEMAPGSRRRLLDEQFLTYMVLTRASQGLRVSYSLADEDGRALVPSLLVTHLKELFPSLQEELLTAEPEFAEDEKQKEQEKEEHFLQYISHPRRTLSHLAVQLGRWKKGEKIPPFWWEVYNWYARDKTFRQLAGLLLGGIFYENRESPLAAETSLQIYGKTLRASVSRLEEFRKCPFAHFLSYGLRLKERQIYRLDLPDIGRFFHAALRNFAVTLQKKGLDWGKLDEESCLQLAVSEVERLVPRLQKEILLSSNRNRYLAEKFKETVSQTALILGEQARHSKFRPAGLELAFGPGRGLPGIVFELEGGFKVELIGRIDRVDLARDSRGQAYLRVIDYKSGKAKLSLPEVFYGLTLQLLVYLDVVSARAPAWLKEAVLPAGALYFRVHTPLISNREPWTMEEVEQKIRKEYKMAGLVLEDLDVVRLMDSSLQKGYSEIIPVALKAKGGFYANSATITAEKLRLLFAHMRQLIKDAAKTIISGEVGISPYRLAKNIACTYCPYKAICQFDISLKGNRYRLLKKLVKEEVWQLLGESQGTEGGTGDDTR